MIGHVSAEINISHLEQLAGQRNELLAQMSVLADGVSTSFVTATKHKAKAGTKPPPDVDSLFFHWRERFDEDWPDVPEDPDAEALEWCYDRAFRLVAQADADLQLRRGQIVTNVTPIHGSEERDKRIIRDYEGYEPGVVAIYERCPAASVKTVRRMFGRNANTGRQ